MCRSKPVGSLVQKVQGFILVLIMIMFSKQELWSMKRHLKYELSFMMNLYMLFNVIQESVRNEITSIMFQGQSYLFQVILS